jgi:hypothetical protein
MTLTLGAGARAIRGSGFGASVDFDVVIRSNSEEIWLHRTRYRPGQSDGCDAITYSNELGS